MAETMEQHAKRYALGSYMAARHGTAWVQAANRDSMRVFAADLFARANGGQFAFGYGQAFDDAWVAVRRQHLCAKEASHG